MFIKFLLWLQLLAPATGWPLSSASFHLLTDTDARSPALIPSSSSSLSGGRCSSRPALWIRVIGKHACRASLNLWYCCFSVASRRRNWVSRMFSSRSFPASVPTKMTVLLVCPPPASFCPVYFSLCHYSPYIWMETCLSALLIFSLRRHNCCLALAADAPAATTDHLYMFTAGEKFQSDFCMWEQDWKTNI